MKTTSSRIYYGLYVNDKLQKVYETLAQTQEAALSYEGDLWIADLHSLNERLGWEYDYELKKWIGGLASRRDSEEE